MQRTYVFPLTGIGLLALATSFATAVGCTPGKKFEDIDSNDATVDGSGDTTSKTTSTGVEETSSSVDSGDSDSGVDTTQTTSELEDSLPKFDLEIPDGDTGTQDLEGDPTNCKDAAVSQTYVGCDFWPTVTFNPVLENFDFAAVVANGGDEDAEVTVQKAGKEVAKVTVAAGGLTKILLPWEATLKGPQFDARTTGPRPKTSVRVNGGAYHLVSSVPVSVWQFNPLQFTEPLDECALTQEIGIGMPTCYSVSNDAALLIPSTAMTGSYRVFLKDTVQGNEGGYSDTPGSVAITATQDDTEVTIALSANGATEAGDGVAAIEAGGTATYMMNAGDVVQLMAKHGKWSGEANSDISGSLISANKPVQAIAAVALTSVPSPEVGLEGYADHLEETILPTQVLGDRYVYVPPTSSKGANIGAYLRFYGNFDNTTLTYSNGKPCPDAPDTLNAGQVVMLSCDKPFEVEGSESFAIGIFGKGGLVHTPQEVPTLGDPAFSVAVAVAQYRSRYIFLAPDDYTVSFADIIMPKGADVMIDSQPLTGTPEEVPGTNWVFVREPLGAGMGGAHILETGEDANGDKYHVGLQVMGYGHATGYMYPGGLNLMLISDIPPK